MENIKEIMTDIVKQCWQDVAFKKRFVTAPIETIEEFTGHAFNLGGYKRLIVKESKLRLGDRSIFAINDNKELVMHLLRKPRFDNMALTDEDLELVAAGCWEGEKIGDSIDQLINFMMAA